MFLFTLEASVTCATDIIALDLVHTVRQDTNFCIYSVFIFFAGIKQED